MLPETYRPEKLFTVVQANATLPLVRAITQDMVNLAHEIQERRQRIETLTAGRTLRSNDPYLHELEQIEESIEQDMLKLRNYVEELRSIGAEAKDPLMGLVDFPCLLDGRLVYLCWKLGEAEILHWHELEAGFSGRRPLTARSVAGSADDHEESAF